METFGAAFERMIGTPAPPIDNDKLKEYWDKPVSELCELPPHEMSSGEKERHRLYCLLLMAVTHHYWNGLKKGREGTYPWNPSVDSQGPYLDRDYLGHNIAALAVDGFGQVADFDFNHNELFSSSAEHAEARLVRRLYSLAQVSSSWARNGGGAALGTNPSEDYLSMKRTSVYTTLESCSQCSGIMALATVKQVVYLQTDPGMYLIGRILRNLTPDYLRAPIPITGAEIGLPYFGELDAEFGRFKEAMKDTTQPPFWADPMHPERNDRSQSVTSFLCTRMARDIYGRARSEFMRLFESGRVRLGALSEPTFRPPEGGMSNAEVALEALDFFQYAITRGKRATAHSG